ncbi:MAG: hydrogenase iron-sulfur subunit [Proteobacteria bacterium]|nr:hydrogenase iron-sulfur subunit [Pseudomonadota bacterium]MBU1688747.1 hydrogenase iron-sulfur subunit [Pseudomonadota bacterium]
MEFEPIIVGFLCNWCAYRAADLAGTMRLRSPNDVRIIRVLCSGAVEPRFVLKAFREGADGVIIGGCHLGGCHYSKGNLSALGRARLLLKLMGQLGIDQARFRLVLVSASEAAAFVEAVGKMRNDLQKLGPVSSCSAGAAAIEARESVP